MTTIGRYCGIDLDPLPYESSFSCLMRFADRNVLRAEQLESILGFRVPTTPIHLAAELLAHRTLADELHWILPESGEATVLRQNPPNIEFISRQVRFCRSCMANAYHSYLYQIQVIDKCPIHNEPLVDHCRNCGHSPSSVRDYFRSPFGCPRCKFPVCFIDPDLLINHLKLRRERQLLTDQLGPISTWYAETHAYRERLASMVTRNDRLNSSLVESCFALTTATSKPITLSTSNSRDVLMLSWRRQLFFNHEVDCAFVYSYLRLNRIRHEASRPVFSVAKKIISLWLQQLRDRDTTESLTQLKVAEDALHRLRLQWRDTEGEALRYSSVMSMIPDKFYEFKENRAAWLYGIFALYSNLYVNLSNGNINTVMELPCEIKFTETHFSGKLILPYIQGLSELFAVKCRRARILKR